MIEEQLIKSIVNMGEIGLFIAGCIIAIKYFTDKEKTNIKNQEEKDKQREATYKEILENLRIDSKKREEALIMALDKQTSSTENTLIEFSNVLHTINENLIEMSAQLSNLGSSVHNDISQVNQRIDKIESGMDKVNEKLGLQKIQKQESTSN